MNFSSTVTGPLQIIAKCAIEFPVSLTMLQDIETSPHNDISSSPT